MGERGRGEGEFGLSFMERASVLLAAGGFERESGLVS
jgi:hypothetical protein